MGRLFVNPPKKNEVLLFFFFVKRGEVLLNSVV